MTEKEKKFNEAEFMSVMTCFMATYPLIVAVDFQGFIAYVSAIESDSPIPGQKAEMLKLARLFIPVQKQMEAMERQADAFVKAREKAPEN